jgi:hypothetical protein
LKIYEGAGGVARKPRLGAKIRRLRRESELTQAQLAQRLMISASYLNLIEHNQRAVTVPLLFKLGEVLNVDLQTLSQDDESIILAELSEILGDPLFSQGDSGGELTPDDLNELVSQSPIASQTILKVYRAYQRARDDIQTLGERLSEDTLYAASSHELRTVLTSIRSFSEILHDNENISPEERQRFLGIIVKESAALSKNIDDLMSFVSAEGVNRAVGTRPPLDEINDFIQNNRNYFELIENAAEKLILDAQFGTYDRLQKLIYFASHELDINVDIGRDREEFGLVNLDKEKRMLHLSNSLPRNSLIFQTAQIIGRYYCADIIEGLLANAPLTSDASREMCRSTLARYFAGAVLLPYDEFLEAARAVRYDIEQLQNQFAGSFEQICHRLATLNKAGSEGVAFHFIRVDIAGNISKRFDGSGIRIPRYGGVCPRWNVHHAFLRPESMNVQTMRMTDGGTFLSLARAIVKPGTAFNAPRSHYAIAIGCEISSASELVYADGMDLNDASMVVSAGTSCRICERDNCGQRAFQSILHSSAEASSEGVARAKKARRAAE